jgi:cytoplasmic tRNA 2-thiolation protein 2
VMPDKSLSSLCADCQSAEASLDVRKRRLCGDCFVRYVQSKVLKRMESYRFKNLKNDQKRRLLLPVSGGVSSVTLLQILDAQLRQQLASRNRTAYDLVVVHLAGPGESIKTIRSWLEVLTKRFLIQMPQPVLYLSDVFKLDPTIGDDLRHLGMQLVDEMSPDEQAQHVLNAAKSVTAGTDLQDLLLNRLMVSFAKQQGCEAILWGHSDSRLAAKALAGVAKGRGGALPFDICDGLTPWKLYFNYPLRDLFLAELCTYARVLQDTFTDLTMENPASHTPTSIRQTSIDDLLARYITTQGEKYPSIMANVVRTVSKLQFPQTGGRYSHCAICATPIAYDANDGLPETQLCYPCTRTKQDIKI